MADELCPCGQPLHYLQAKSRASVEALIKTLGPNIDVSTPDGAWKVPRHYIALHGIKADELPALAERYHWVRATFICPKCRMISYHPKDLAEGYCGRCHEFTGR